MEQHIVRPSAGGDESLRAGRDIGLRVHLPPPPGPRRRTEAADERGVTEEDVRAEPAAAEPLAGSRREVRADAAAQSHPRSARDGQDCDVRDDRVPTRAATPRAGDRLRAVQRRRRSARGEDRANRFTRGAISGEVARSGGVPRGAPHAALPDRTPRLPGNGGV